MNYFSTEAGIIVENLNEFNLYNTFECGQCFRWNFINNEFYRGIVKNKVISITQKDDTIVINGITLKDFENYFIDYFDFKRDYKKIKEELSTLNEVLAQACSFSCGIRILRQEPWEALCSFIISQNNNIPRIKSIVEKLCQLFGEKIYDNFYTFPSAEKIACLSESDLCELRCGFRDKYILDAAKKVAFKEIDLKKISKLPLEQARLELLKIRGVGPKVAECTLLYGMHRLEAFPVDVWMKKALTSLFKGLSPKDFGQYAGIAQQYIFHYSRMNSKDLF